MEYDPNEERFQRIERKLNLLVAMCAVQLFFITVLVFSQLIPSTFTTFLLVLAVVGFLYVFRNQIPNWFGKISRFVFDQMISAQKPNSMKDVK